jgi:hypothetical protein
MTAENLARVWGANLMRSKRAAGVSLCCVMACMIAL